MILVSNRFQGKIGGRFTHGVLEVWCFVLYGLGKDINALYLVELAANLQKVFGEIQHLIFIMNENQ